ncbi:hypothetical protein AcV5_009131 [Taiwanofungus camphoratus]|nr:hypothetical protein AcV5_009131 [Antrodia cinnamomea]
MPATAPAPALAIAPIRGALPTSSPHLMPFHVAYAGPAPVSTYFRVRPAPEPTFGKAPSPASAAAASPPTSARATPPPAPAAAVASSSSATLGSAMSASSADTAVAGVDVEMAGGAAGGAEAVRRFVAAFRGRTVHGLEVGLPEGYAGVVLRAPGEEGSAEGGGSWKGTQKTGAKSRAGKTGRQTRGTRRARKAADADVAEHGEDGGDCGEDADADARLESGRLGGEDGAARVLRPVSAFSSFVLWNPDIPVDEGRDEYLRTLTEWTRLAAEIHRFEE